MKNLMFCLLALLLSTGCRASIDSNEILSAQAACADHLGVDYISAMNGVMCNDSKQFMSTEAYQILQSKTEQSTK